MTWKWSACEFKSKLQLLLADNLGAGQEISSIHWGLWLSHSFPIPHIDIFVGFPVSEGLNEAFMVVLGQMSWWEVIEMMEEKRNMKLKRDEVCAWALKTEGKLRVKEWDRESVHKQSICQSSQSVIVKSHSSLHAPSRMGRLEFILTLWKLRWMSRLWGGVPWQIPFGKSFIMELWWVLFRGSGLSNMWECTRTARFRAEDELPVWWCSPHLSKHVWGILSSWLSS